MNEKIRGANIQIICPEYLGGLEIPRRPAEIQGYSGERVLDGLCKVLNNNGEDVTYEFVDGAKKALIIAKACGATKAILKSKSPSCGSGIIHDGTFSGKTIKGDGVTAAILKRNGIQVYTEENYPW